jgi:hypothetical protein
MEHRADHREATEVEEAHRQADLDPHLLARSERERAMLDGDALRLLRRQLRPVAVKREPRAIERGSQDQAERHGRAGRVATSRVVKLLIFLLTLLPCPSIGSSLKI